MEWIYWVLLEVIINLVTVALLPNHQLCEKKLVFVKSIFTLGVECWSGVCSIYTEEFLLHLPSALFIYSHTMAFAIFKPLLGCQTYTSILWRITPPYCSTRICPKHDWILTLGLINDGSPISNFQCSEVLKQKLNERNVSVQFESTDIEGANCSNWSDCPSQLLQIRQTNHSAVSRCASIS